jgi:hypothetical protein
VDSFMRLFFVLPIFFILLQSCSPRINELPTVDLQNPGSSKVARLSEMLSNCNLVKLETSNDILIGESTKYLVSDKFIITAGPERILLFSNSGKYIKTIATSGRGPNEYLNIVATGLDEKNNILYLNQRDDPGNILAYSILENNPVKKFSTGIKNLLYYIVVLNDTLLAISPGINFDCNFLFLSTSGRIVYTVKPPEGIGLGISISKLKDHFYYKPKQNDTVYIMRKFEKISYCFLNVENRATLANQEQGNFVSIPVIGFDFMIAQKIHASSIQIYPNDVIRFKYDLPRFYWINKKDFSVNELTGFHNDFFGTDEPFSDFRSHFSVCNEYGFLRYSAFELKQILNKAIGLDIMPDSIKLKIHKLNDELNEQDNPVLLIGKLK